MRAKNLILTKRPSSNFDKENRVVKLLFGLAHQDNMTKHNREGNRESKFFFDICSCGMTKSYTCYYYVDHGEINHITLYENNSKIAGCNKYQYKMIMITLPQNQKNISGKISLIQQNLKMINIPPICIERSHMQIANLIEIEKYQPNSKSILVGRLIQRFLSIFFSKISFTITLNIPSISVSKIQNIESIAFKNKIVCKFLLPMRDIDRIAFTFIFVCLVILDTKQLLNNQLLYSSLIKGQKTGIYENCQSN